MEAGGQAARDGSPRIVVRDAACRRGGRILFSGLSLALAPGEAALIAGPNGIGKSSLLRMLCGLLPLFAGTIDREGALALADDRLALDADRPLGQALAFWAHMDGRADALSEAMVSLALSPLADVPVRMLSTGQRKRAVLARVIASCAPIWLLDEPANGLDTASIDLLGDAVTRHLATGGIVIAASHQPLPWPHNASLILTRPVEPEDEA